MVLHPSVTSHGNRRQAAEGESADYDAAPPDSYYMGSHLLTRHYFAALVIVAVAASSPSEVTRSVIGPA
jgi:hypothetical protein